MKSDGELLVITIYKYNNFIIIYNIIIYNIIYYYKVFYLKFLSQGPNTLMSKVISVPLKLGRVKY